MTTSIPKTQIFLKALLERYHPGNEQDLLNLWNSKNNVEIINRIGQLKGDPQDLLIDPRSAIKTIHYSWIAEAMEKLPKDLHLAILSSLADHQQHMLCQTYKVEAHSLKRIPSNVQFFLLKKTIPTD